VPFSTPLKIFERFWWSYTQKIVDAFHSEGIMLTFHLDMRWDKNIHYFKELPRKSIMIELDGTTNIFAVVRVPLSETQYISFSEVDLG
jgi:hypothetical protein